MKTVLFFVLTAISFYEGAAQQRNDTAQLWPPGKFIGYWEMKAKRYTLYESWSKIGVNTLLGKSSMISYNDDTTNLEIILLTLEGNTIYYTPTNIGQNNNNPIRFTLTSLVNNTYIFENTTNDFPKRIMYHFPAEGLMYVNIDAGANSKKRKDYVYKKIKNPARDLD